MFLYDANSRRYIILEGWPAAATPRQSQSKCKHVSGGFRAEMSISYALISRFSAPAPASDSCLARGARYSAYAAITTPVAHARHRLRRLRLLSFGFSPSRPI